MRQPHMGLLRLLSVAAAVLAAAWSASAGWVIEQGIKGGGEGLRQQLFVQANQMKTVTLGPDGKPMSAFIVDLGRETITQVHYHDRSYVRSTVQEFVRMMHQARQAASAQLARASRDLEQALKDLPPEQRKALEQATRVPGPSTAGADCAEPRVEIRKTGQQATIAGYAATRYDLVVDGKGGTELWVARDLTAWQELDPQKLERFFTDMTAGAACGPGRPSAGFGNDWAWRLPRDGYAVRTVTPGGATVEVTRAERRTLAADEFQPPTGFSPKTLPKVAQ